MKKKGNITIYDISRKLKISAATVSRALNDNPRTSATTKALVLKTAKEMNYNQNRLALALKSGKSKVVGVIVPFLNRSFFSTAIRGIEEELGLSGYHVVICQTHENVESEIQHIGALLDAQVDGIFLSVSKTTQNGNHLTQILDQGKPLIFFDRKIEVPGTSSVVIDDFKGAYDATEHLIKQGCKRIAHFSGDLHLKIYQNRLKGYLAALEDYNLQVNADDYVIHTNSKVETGASAMIQLWKMKRKPDAIFSASDFAIIGALQELRKLKVQIPHEISLVGFSNESFTKYMELPISSVDQTPLKMGKTAAQLFLNKINLNEPLKKENNIVLLPELCTRGSSIKELVLQ